MDINEELKLNKWACDMAEQKSSGLPQKEWCSMKDIPANTFQYRCRQVRLAMEARMKNEKPDNTALVPADHNVKTPTSDDTVFAKVELTGRHNVPLGINIKFQDSLVNIAPDVPDSHVRMVLEVITDAK